MEGWKGGGMEGWKDGRMEGWKEGKAGLRIAYSNQKFGVLHRLKSALKKALSWFISKDMI